MQLTKRAASAVTLSATTFRIHRWLGWLIGLQVLVWVGGGVVFSLVPFTAWVKGGDTVKPPVVVLPAGWVERAAPTLQAAAQRGDVVAVAAVATPQGPAPRVSYRAAATPSSCQPTAPRERHPTKRPCDDSPPVSTKAKPS